MDVLGSLVQVALGLLLIFAVRWLGQHYVPPVQSSTGDSGAPTLDDSSAPPLTRGVTITSGSVVVKPRRSLLWSLLLAMVFVVIVLAAVGWDTLRTTAPVPEVRRAFVLGLAGVALFVAATGGFPLLDLLCGDYRLWSDGVSLHYEHRIAGLIVGRLDTPSIAAWDFARHFPYRAWWRQGWHLVRSDTNRTTLIFGEHLALTQTDIDRIAGALRARRIPFVDRSPRTVTPLQTSGEDAARAVDCEVAGYAQDDAGLARLALKCLLWSSVYLLVSIALIGLLAPAVYSGWIGVAAILLLGFIPLVATLWIWSALGPRAFGPIRPSTAPWVHWPQDGWALAVGYLIPLEVAFTLTGPRVTHGYGYPMPKDLRLAILLIVPIVCLAVGALLARRSLSILLRAAGTRAARTAK